MAKRNCEDCAYATRPKSHWLRIILSRWPGLLICFNCAACPGELTETRASGTCRNFYPRCRQGERVRPPKPRDDKVRYIPLSRGLFTMVDAEDFEELSKYKWYALRALNTFYAARRVGRDTILMHRVLMQPPAGMVVDHIDGNGLNNRRSNLRICTPAQNAVNSRDKGARSGFKGVEYAPKNKVNKYRGVVHHEGKRISAGSYKTAVEAALARDRKAREVEGEYAYLNFPEGTGRSARPVGRRGKTALKRQGSEPAPPGSRGDTQAQ